MENKTNRLSNSSLPQVDLLQTSVIIIGAGLSGLYAAYLLKKRGINAIILEARSRIGGRIHSIPFHFNEGRKHQDNARYDMGPAWFWPETNPLFEALVKELGLIAFTQYSSGDYLIDESMDKEPKAYPSHYINQPSSHRLEGGMLSIIEGLLETLAPNSVILDTQVTTITKTDNDGYQLTAVKNGQEIEFKSNCVITAMPLRLLNQSIQFSPALPLQVQKKMQSLPTWMAAHAKILALYPTPFWRAQGFSGSAMSYLGPMAEIHDASANLTSNGTGRGALFGFLAVNAMGRQTAGVETLKAMAIKQLTRIFGPHAAEPLSIELLDWYQEPLTATHEDSANLAHPVYGLGSSSEDATHPNLMFAGTEAASRNGGYLEGALEAAATAVEYWYQKQG